jgi:hypothetical protein
MTNCYDELKSGSLEPVDGEEAFARLKAKTEARRNRSAMSSGCAFHPAAFADIDEIRRHAARNYLDAADPVTEEIFDTIHGLVPFP